jgi:methionyl-tRNA synthetase
MADPKAYYVTTPIYYVNDAPHIGHAYTTVAGDVLTRWHRQRGDRTWFLTGTDEHGTKVQQAAERNAVAPQQWVDQLVAGSWQPMLQTIDAANYDFIRTTSERHSTGVQRFWQVIKDKGYVYQDTFEGPYCVGCEEFKQPGDLVAGTGELAGQQLCPIHGKPVEQLREENWFFRLSAFTDRLLEHYERYPDFVAPSSARNEVVSFVKQGLRDISMSRSSVSWGIPLAWDSGQVTYVWFDALLNYITAIGYGAAPGSRKADEFDHLWPADVHLVGKDILRFHAVFWPAMLMAADLPLPKQVFAHGWLLVGGEKMSKSKLTGISPEQITEAFGSDAFRYYFLRAIVFGSDGSFSWEDMAARYNAELANGLGNLASRAQAMIGKYFAGELPQPGPYTNADAALRDLLSAVVQDADAGFTALRFSEGIAAVRSFVEAVNAYVTEQEPWRLAKDPQQQQRLATVLYTVAECLRAIAVLYHPVMPKAAETIWQSIGGSAIGELSGQRIGDVSHWGQLPPGAAVTKTAALFPRLATE